MKKPKQMNALPVLYGGATGARLLQEERARERTHCLEMQKKYLECRLLQQSRK
jgi:hypothetical protein